MPVLTRFQFHVPKNGRPKIAQFVGSTFDQEILWFQIPVDDRRPLGMQIRDRIANLAKGNDQGTEIESFILLLELRANM